MVLPVAGGVVVVGVFAPGNGFATQTGRRYRASAIFGIVRIPDLARDRGEAECGEGEPE